MTDYVQPTVNAEAFHCPHCGSFSDQHWNTLRVYTGKTNTEYGDYMVGYCRRCKKVTLWFDQKMIFPLTGNAPLPNPDMPQDIKDDYNEARDIVTRSPRSACTLLRLSIEKICDEQGAKGKDLNAKIGKLVESGLDSSIQKALDAVRVIGGQAGHPLQMDLKDDTKTAEILFKIVNYISEWAHTRTKTIDGIFEGLPDNKKDAIKKRDNKS